MLSARFTPIILPALLRLMCTRLKRKKRDQLLQCRWYEIEGLPNGFTD